MKLYHSLTLLFLLFLSACDKEDPAPLKTPQEIVNEEVTEAIAAQSDLTDFAEAFEALELKAEEVENGITVFAPANANAGGRMNEAQQDSAQLTPEALKGHIVKGLIEALNLKDGDILTALDGKELVVSIAGDEIRINGVLISSKDLAKGEKYIIHKVETIIGEYVAEEPASLTVTVWNSLLWSAADPQGKPEAGVAVAFYASPEDYVSGDPVYEGQTDQEGKVIFANAQAGTTYYVWAQKGDVSNVFNRSPEPLSGVYLGFFAEGIFQSQEEISSSSVVQPGAAPGNLRWRDLNGDGVINNDDRGALPHPQVTAVAGNTALDVLIGYDNNDAATIRDEEDANATLRAVIDRTNAMYKTVVMMDGILSDDAECQPGTQWCEIDGFGQSPTNAKVMKIWDLAYRSIGELNLLLRDVPPMTFAGKEQVVAKASALRGFIYLQLVTYFGDVPVPEDVWLSEAQTRNPKDEVYALLIADLESAAETLPAGASGDRSVLTADAAKVLLARVALLKGDFARADALTSEMIDGGRYQLAISREELFADSTNAEIIWNLSSGVDGEFTQYFFGRSVGPIVRLGQVYLIQAEANIAMANLEKGRGALDIIRSRLGLSPSAGLTAEDLNSELRETWKQEMSREGDRFVNLVRWNLAESVLTAKGYNSAKHNLLPIPQVVMDQYYNIFQNPGY